MAENKEFGLYLSDCMWRANKSVKDLAELTGISSESIRRYRRGAVPRRESILKMAQSLNVDHHEMWEISTGRRQQGSVNPLDSDDLRQERDRQITGHPDLLALLISRVEVLEKRTAELERILTKLLGSL